MPLLRTRPFSRSQALRSPWVAGATPSSYWAWPAAIAAVRTPLL